MVPLKTRKLVFAALTLLAVVPVFAQGNSGQARVSANVHHDLSPRLMAMPPLPPQAKAPYVVPLGRIPHRPRSLTVDSVVQAAPGQNIVTTSGSSFEGIGNGIYGYTVTSAPPNPEGAAGLTQYVQWVNTAFAVFNKSNGALLYGPANGNTLWTGFGGPCETTNDGDPNVQYDKIAHRWVLSQFANAASTTGPYYECVAVSQTEDATGSWYRYAFSYAGSAGFIDYPKVGVWPDAYYVSYNMFDSSNLFLGAQACAFDRAAMLAGHAATQVCFMLDPLYGGVLPSDLDGYTLPPNGAPNYLVGYQTNGSVSSLNLFKFHVDFATPASSSLTGPTSMSVSAFNEACTGTNPCSTIIIPQPGTTTTLDSLGDRPMYRLAYRNFGDHEALVVNHAVLTVSGNVGVRWYELRDPNGTPTVYQASTWAPDTDYRWMGSMAMDDGGNIALGYSVSSSTTYPSIRYTGRLAGDTLNTLGSENTILTGTASQTTGAGGALHRWGDHTSMAVDPDDDCTFWYANEYIPSNGTFNWRTRIASFKFPSCITPARMLSPASGSTIPGSSATFAWTHGSGPTSYWIWIGTTVGNNNLYDASQGANTSATVNGLPTSGGPVYLRLFSWINNAWQFNDYMYYAAGPASMVSPTPGSTFPGSSVQFTWTQGTGVTSYWMWIGTTFANNNLYDASQRANTSATVNNLPINGGRIYVRLFSWINSAWQYIDYTYTAAGTPVPATMISPTPGSTLPGSSVQFTWTTGSGVVSYWIWIGTTAGNNNLYDASQGTNTSVTLNNVPTNGGLVYLRLFSWINNAWQYHDYSYTASGTAVPATLISPTPGSTLHGSSVQFSWTAGSGVTSYWMWIGTTVGNNNLYDASQGSKTSVTVTGLPTNGSTIYLRLLSWINNAWQYSDYSYITGP